MPTQSLRAIQIEFGGGWATERGSHFNGIDGATVRIPFWTDAENGLYELNGAPHKFPGVDEMNATAISESGTNQAILGLYEFIRFGTLGSESRRRVCHAGTRIMSENLDGVWAALFTGLESGRIPAYATFDDLLILSSDSTTDVPRSWDLTTAQNLAGSPPRFSFSVAHKNRHWAAGVWTLPSRLYYSASLDPEDWTGAGSGNIDVDPNDGDMITGLIPHKNDLWVFKGPYKGSIHRITGSAPTGSDAFARIPFVSGIGTPWHNCIFRFGDDVGFLGIQSQVHSLAATAAFGDYIQAFLSAPIFGFLKEQLNPVRLRFASTATQVSRGVVYIAVTQSGLTQNNLILAMDYRFSPVWWSLIRPPSNVGSIAIMKDIARRERPYFGGYGGVAWIGDQSVRSWDGTAYTFLFTSPFLSLGLPDNLKTLYGGTSRLVPKGDYNLTLTIRRDNAATQDATIAQLGADVLGTSTAPQFTLGTSRLGGAETATQPFDLPGEFRNIQLRLSQAGNNEDTEPHGMSLHVLPGPISMETTR